MIQNHSAAPAASFNQILKLATGLLGMSGVALGALGAHALKVQLATSSHTETWNTAVLYHLIHTIAILAVSVRPAHAGQSGKSCYLTAACVFWMVGVILFSGSLYLLALGGPHWLGPITPLGGLALLIGWGCVLATALKAPSTQNDQ